MSTKMAVSQPWHFGSRGKLAKSEQTHLSRRHTRLRYLHMWSEQPCLQSGTTHRQASGQISHLPSGVPRHLLRNPEGWSTPLSKYNWGRHQTTAETAELHTPECCSVPRWSPLALATGSSALLDWGLHLPCCPPGSGDPSLQDADNSLAHRADSQTFRPRLWDSGSLSPNWLLCVCYIPLRLLECE